MANTVIALKKSGTPSAIPSSLANGELAINFADGKLFYKAANGTIVPFGTSGGNSFGTVNANGTLVVAGTSEAIVTLIPGPNIQIVGDAINDTITVSATAASGGGYFQGNDGSTGAENYGDIFRSHSNTLSANVTILSGNNSLAAGPVTVQAGQTIIIQTGARVVIV